MGKIATTVTANGRTKRTVQNATIHAVTPLRAVVRLHGSLTDPGYFDIELPVDLIRHLVRLIDATASVEYMTGPECPPGPVDEQTPPNA